MKFHIFILTWLTAFAYHDGAQSTNLSRTKREAAGALHIVNNHDTPIHADVKRENAGLADAAEKVIPPQDMVYQTKSLRKSLLETPTKVDLVRNTMRVVTLAVLVVTAVLEFYPLLSNLYHMLYSFLYL